MKKLLITLLSLASCRGIEFNEIGDNHILAATLVLEAGGEKENNAMAAVYEVIQNRAERRNMSERDVVLQRLQFSCWNNTEKRIKLYLIARKHPKFNRAMNIVRATHKTNYTKGADHYHADFVEPYWINTMEHTVTIGSHLFYRPEGH